MTREGVVGDVGGGLARLGGRYGAGGGPRRGALPVGVVAFTAALVALWLVVDPRTPDLAAQVYRVGLFKQIGFAVWDENWYAGHQLPGYSLLYPPLAALLGIRLLGAVCVLASSALFALLARKAYGSAARWGTAWFAVGAVGDVWSGRMTFALGVCLGLAAALAFARGWGARAAALALLCAAASPVAGALLGLAALTLSLTRRSPRPLLTLAAPAAALVLASVALFPEGGWEPYPILSFAATAAVVLGFLLALPRSARLLRVGAWVYLLACVACLAVRSPVGSNIERYGVLLAGPLLVCELVSRRAAGASGPRSAARLASGRAWVAALALCATAVWVVWGPVRETLAVAGSEATSAAYYAPVERFLARAGAAEPVRVEVPLTRSHWEAALLAPHVSLARGWEKQMETRYDHVLIGGALTAASYERWLHKQAVSYVALPDVALDPSSAREGRLIRGGLPYLREVFASAHWRVYKVLAATPIASGPGRLVSLAHDSFALDARSPGSFLVRVHFTRYLTVVRGSGCVLPAAGGWTTVRLRAAGSATVAARFSLSRAFAGGGSCTRAASTAAARSAPASAPGAAQAPYRWLVRTEGPAPSIAAENRAPGTTSWRLPGPADEIGGEAHGAIAGYVAEQAIGAGEAQSVYVTAPGARSVRIDVYRMGWYGGRGGRLALRSALLPTTRQPGCTHRHATGLTECDWRATLTFKIPNALASGVYIAKLRSSGGAESDCLFVVRPSAPPPLLVEIPTASYERTTHGEETACIRAGASRWA